MEKAFLDGKSAADGRPRISPTTNDSPWCACVFFPSSEGQTRQQWRVDKKKRERKVTFILLRLLQRRKWSHFIVLWGDVITWHDDLLFSDWCDDTWETHIGPDKFFPSVWSRHFTLYFCVWSRKWANRVTARSCCCCFFISLYFFAVIIRILYSLPKRASPSSSSPWYI